MTLQECAIVTAYTGISMLRGKKYQIFLDYATEKLGYPFHTFEMATDRFWEKLKQVSEEDFFELCRKAEENEKEEE